MNNILLEIIIIQTIAQTALFIPAGWVLKVCLQGFVNFFGIETRSKINKIIFVNCLALNVFITIFAKSITGQSSITGNANLGASCILSLVMWWTFRERGIYGIKKWTKK